MNLRQPGGHKDVVPITGNVTLTNHHVGKVIITTSDTTNAYTITLPDPDGVNKGGEIQVLNESDYVLTITSATSDKFVAKNNALASSVSLGTTLLMVGGAFGFFSTGTKWFTKCYCDPGATVTVSG